jgi:glucose/mannose-6-phosphate isomerase
MNHNEIIGWEGGANNLAVVVLRSGDDHPRSMIRMDITRHLFEQQGAAVHSVEDRGAGRLQRTMYFVHFGDWLSLLLAEKQGVDPVSITSIDFLKNELAKLA